MIVALPGLFSYLFSLRASNIPQKLLMNARLYLDYYVLPMSIHINGTASMFKNVETLTITKGRFYLSLIILNHFDNTVGTARFLHCLRTSNYPV